MSPVERKLRGATLAGVGVVSDCTFFASFVLFRFFHFIGSQCGDVAHLARVVVVQLDFWRDQGEAGGDDGIAVA